VAASAGTVTVVTCQAIAPDGSDYGCDRDGSPTIKGCGWYLEIQHGAGIVTRYCHMLTRPAVAEGQPVVAGQVIGVVGSSGHSSGPHLHYEVHEGAHSSATATDPVPFMAARCAPLGEPNACRFSNSVAHSQKGCPRSVPWDISMRSYFGVS